MKDWTTTKHFLLGVALLAVLPLAMRLQSLLAPVTLDVHLSSNGAHLMLKLFTAS